MRMHATRHKLHAALQRLIDERPVHPSLQGRTYRLTVTTLAREARVCRNAIYSNHRVIIEALRAGAPAQVTRSTQDELEQHSVIEALKAAERRLVTENATLLKRALDAEAEAERHRRHNARLIAERDQANRAVRIR
jgi:hypothetical protein